MFLENIAVQPEAAGRGVGKALMACCEDAARRADLPAIKLYTNEKMVKNLKIYPHLGYHETGRRSEDGFNRVYFEKPL
ncbi:GNAT family N-acetyltransferase [Epibacterium ulvae]|uniref:GNAT family N-acetyltransferase n=1 Tax=Epibacterium ulvae TaxID=1156985 RepID=UPI00203F9AE5|nr:GNAT family N-acetyltransferase [Epibacterium ulvae]